QELSESTTPHKKRASSWATLKDLAEEAAEESLDGATGGRGTGAAAQAAGSDVDMRKTISSPALRQMLSHHRGSSATAAAAAAATASAGMLRIDGRGGGGGGGVGSGALLSQNAAGPVPSG
ncbi:unnamed protein product, partial [Hapterophycus canaliculatus]